MGVRRRIATMCGVVLLLAVAACQPVPPAGPPLYRVDAGGGGQAGSPAWEQDSNASPSSHATWSDGRVLGVARPIDLSDPSVPAGTPAGLFQVQRWDGSPAPEMGYSFSVASGTQTTVRIYLAETYFSSAGARKFDIAIDGQVAFGNVDIFSLAGGADRGIVLGKTITSDGTVDVSFGHVLDNPTVAAVEVLGGSTTTPSATLGADATSVAFPATAPGATTNRQITLTNTGATGAPSLKVQSTTITGADASVFSDTFNDAAGVTLAAGQSTTFTASFKPTQAGNRSASLTVAHDGTGGPVVIPLAGSTPAATASSVRVNTGGPTLAGSPPWQADSNASPSSYATWADGRVLSVGNAIDLSHPSVPAGTPAELFQVQRWDGYKAPALGYAFPGQAGATTTVKIYLAETYFSAAGARTFDILIDGAVAFPGVDIFALAGGKDRGIVLSKTITSDGTVDVTFAHGVDNPSVAGIEVVGGGSTTPVATLAATPSSVTFPATATGATANQQITLVNQGGSGAPSLVIDATTIGGQDAGMFSDTFNDAANVTLAPGQSTTITASFKPTAAGARSATLNVVHDGSGSPLAIALSGSTPGTSTTVSFGKSTVSGTNVAKPTTLQFGPDGRLYVATIKGQVKTYAVTRNGKDSYSTSGTETLELIRQIPNHDDDGSVNSSVTDRLVTGIAVGGTASNPVIYVVSSDPRIGAGTSGTDLNLDTNSGVLSKLTKSGGTWTRQDLVRGLPRSEENHTGNGLTLLSSTQLLIAYGGNTNKGAPSHNFAELPEYALSGAILKVDLGAIGSSTYDLPTLDDPTRAGSNDAGDPFGGNDGLNQAKLVPGGPVSIYAPGFRNPYDLAVGPGGKIYTIDNGGNAGWGDYPLPDSAAGTCTNAVRDSGTSDPDTLHLISQGYYGGHPNPTRANKSNTFGGQSPVTTANPIECDYIPPDQHGLTTFPTSTNGLTMYTTGNFGGKLQGDLITASYNNSIYRIDMDASGTSVLSKEVLFSSVGSFPLDVVAQPAGGPFPGTLWVADHSAGSILVFEPADYGGGGVTCTGADDPALDEDSDGFDNADEIDNGTNPCSPADVPPDNDGDKTSDLNDPDDDNDGIADAADVFAIDATNGVGATLPRVFTWDNDAPPAGGILGLGFTGLMTNGTAKWNQQYDPDQMTAGGAAGVVTVDAVPEGDALGGANSQLYGLQTGVDVSASSGVFRVHTRVQAPFAAMSPVAGQSFGLQLGAGTQDDYLKLVVSGGGGFQVVKEVGGAATTTNVTGPAWPGPGYVDLWLQVDPAANTVQPYYSLAGASPVAAGPAQSIPSAWITRATGLAMGIIGTSAGPGAPYPATWDFLEAQPGPVVGGGVLGSARLEVSQGAPLEGGSTYSGGSFKVSNASTGGLKIASVEVDLTDAILPDLIFDPNGTGGDTLGKGFTVDSNGGTGTISNQMLLARDGGFGALRTSYTDFGPGETMTFSIDIDPTSVKGATAPGPSDSASVTGSELTGATFKVTYQDGTVQTARIWKAQGGSTGAGRAVTGPFSDPSIGLTIVGAASPSTVTSASQTARVTGPAGTQVQVLVAEGGLYTAGLAGGGYDIDPYEANKILSMGIQTVTIPSSGTIDVPITLTKTGAEGGWMRIAAGSVRGDAIGGTSPVRVLRYNPTT